MEPSQVLNKLLGRGTDTGGVEFWRQPERSGWLMKQGEFVKTWRRRWFILKDGKIFWFKTDIVGPSTQPRGIIEVNKCLSIKGAEDAINKPHAFEISTTDQNMYFIADSDKEKEDWINDDAPVTVKYRSSAMQAVCAVSGAVRPCANASAGRRAVARAALRAAPVQRRAAARGAVRVLAQAAATSSVDVAELNSKFGTNGVEVKAGRGGLPTVHLKSAAGAAVEIALFGGCVTSWKTAEGREVLYIRPDAVFDKSKPISGGIPHCFPQFGPGAIQLHGFARNVDWSLAASKNDGGNPAISLLLTDTDYTRAMWPHSFKAVYTVRLEGETLHTLLEVTNTGDSEFDFTASLHSYFGIDDIETANVRGLQGLEYLDRVADAKHPSVHKELRELVTFRGPVDSVYKSAPSKVTLDTRSGDVAIASNGWPEVVVWTPWTAMEACYREFVCVENAQATSAVKLAPGQSWAATTAMAFTTDPLVEFCAGNPDDPECRVYDD